AIRAWLIADGSGFHSNVAMIEEGQEQGSLRALIDPAPDAPVGYCLRGDSYVAIFETRKSLRGKGLGRTLAGYVVAEAESEDLPGLWGECRPRDSLGFWEKVG